MKTEQAKVTVDVNGKEFSRDYTKVIFENAEDVLAELSKPDVKDEKGAVKESAVKDFLRDFNYGRDLKIRASIRASILEQSAGPEKSIAKAVEGIIKMGKMFGKDISEADALAQVKANAASFGITL